MNKKLIAMAVAAGIAAPMSANAAPTLYGHLSAEISSEDRDNSNTGTTNVAGGQAGVVQGGGGRFQEDIGIDDNKRGRLGVKGSEDLGGGLKAIYKFEWQVDTTDANSSDGARESFVGLKGSFGEIKLGSLKSAYKYMGGVKYDPFVTTEIEARRYGGMSFGRYGQNSFLRRNLSYKNKFGMAKLWINYGLSEQDGEDGDYVLGLSFGNKKWEAGFVALHDADTANNPSTSTTADQAYDALKAFGKVKFGSVTVRGQYEDMTEERTGASDRDGSILFAGVDFKIGKGMIVAQYGVGEWNVPGSTTQDSDYLAVGYIHKFSKKTRIFGGYGTTSVDNVGNVANANNTRDALTIGMRIDF